MYNLYSSYGSNYEAAGTLSVLVKESGSGSGWNTVYTVNGNQGDSWSTVTLNLGGDFSRVRFQYLTTSVTYYGYGDLGIDNIQVSAFEVPTPSPTCEGRYSDFETDNDGWHKDGFLRRSGEDSPRYTGPDGASSGSYYMWVDSTSNSGQGAIHARIYARTEHTSISSTHFDTHTSI